MRKMIWIIVLVLILVSCNCFAIESVPSYDGGTSVAYATLSLNVTNEAPEILGLSLGSVYEDDGALCNATSVDREGDPISYYYTWYVNGVVVDFSGNSLPSDYFVAGDIVGCEAIAYDRYDEGGSAIVAETVLAVPVKTKVVKGALALAGVHKSAAELEIVAQENPIAITGFVVSEVGGTSGSYFGIMAMLIVILGLVNVNLFYRLRKHKKSKACISS